MADLISRAAALDVINTWGRQKSEKVRMGLLHSDLDAIPAVDAVPVVRCKYCKHRDPEDHRCDSHLMMAYPLPVEDDFFCAGGEQREAIPWE